VLGRCRDPVVVVVVAVVAADIVEAAEAAAVSGVASCYYRCLVVVAVAVDGLELGIETA